MKEVIVTVNNGGKDGKTIEKILVPANHPTLWGEIKRSKPIGKD